MDMILVNLEDLAPESGVTPIRGEERDPHHSSLDAFVRMPEVTEFAKKYGGEDPDEWLNWWLKKPLDSIGGVSPYDALVCGDMKLVLLRVRQNISKR